LFIGGVILIINYGHRGASGYYPENTMIAFEKAVELGANGIETDVQMTKDGVLVLIHDESVERTTNGLGYVKDYSYNELKKLNSSSYMKNYSGKTYIPTVDEFLLFAKTHDLYINFEFKNSIFPYNKMENKLIDAILRSGIDDKVILSSFNHYSLVRCKEICPHIKTGILYMEALYRPEAYCVSVKADALHPYYLSVDNNVITSAQKVGIKVNPFTINDEKTMKNFISIGVDGIITNYPDKLKRALLKT